MLLFACRAILAQAPKTDPAPPADGMAVVQRLLDRGKLELSTRPSSAAERFHFLCKTQAGGKDAGLATRCFYVIRDRDRVAVVSWPGDENGIDRPSVYSTNGLTVAVDPDRPGGLILLEGGGPDVMITHDGNSLVMKFGAKSDGDNAAASVLLDVAPILKSAMTKARRSNYDARTGVVQMDLGQLVLNLIIPPDPGEQTILGFDELMIGNEDTGAWVKVSKTAGPKLDYFSVTADAVRQLGLPVRTPGKEFDARRLWVASVDFDRDTKLREAAEKLHTLFKPRTKAKPRLDKEQR
jgi:hypothetical protein